MMTKKLTVIFIIIIAASLITAGLVFALGGAGGGGGDGDDAGDELVTIVKPQPQDGPERPDVFPDPEEDWVKLPESDNLALGKPVTSGEVTEVYASANVVDGDTNTYWESRGVPADITIDLQAAYDIQTIGIRLNPTPIWEARTQNVEISVSTDGSSYSVIVPDARFEFNPDSGNIVRIDFDAVQARYVQLNFTAKSSGRSNGGQAAEICIFG